MKSGIHPNYKPVTASCVCGNVFTTGSTGGDIRTEICSACHPFFTGTQKIVDTEGRVDRFMKKFAASNALKTRGGAAPAEKQG